MSATKIFGLPCGCELWEQFDTNSVISLRADICDNHPDDRELVRHIRSLQAENEAGRRYAETLVEFGDNETGKYYVGDNHLLDEWLALLKGQEDNVSLSDLHDKYLPNSSVDELREENEYARRLKGQE